MRVTSPWLNLQPKTLPPPFDATSLKKGSQSMLSPSKSWLTDYAREPLVIENGSLGQHQNIGSVMKNTV